MNNLKKHAFAACAALTLSACSVATAIKPTLQIDLPSSWASSKDGATPYQAQDWIVQFSDDTLINLVNEALANNHNLKIAAANLARATAEVKQAGAEFLPSLDLKTNSTRSKSSLSQFGGGAPRNEFGVSLDLSWEVDMWGRIRAGSQAIEYEYYAAEYDYAAAQQSLAAQTAKAYFSAIETTLQLELAEGYAANIEKTLAVTTAFYQEGLSSLQNIHVIKADYARAKESVQNAKSTQLSALRSLELLLGRYPGADMTIASVFPTMPNPVASGIPSDVLERRPDIRAAERRVAAAFYRIEQSEAAKLPAINLTASYGRNSNELNKLTDPASLVWNLAGNLLFPIFNSGSLDAQVDIQTAEQKSAIASYQQTAFASFSEVETALSNEHLFRVRQTNLNDAYSHAKQSEIIADENFKAGEIDLLDLLQIKGSTITTNIDRIRAQRELLDQRINLHLALGGSVGS